MIDCLQRCLYSGLVPAATTDVSGLMYVDCMITDNICHLGNMFGICLISFIVNLYSQIYKLFTVVYFMGVESEEVFVRLPFGVKWLLKWLVFI